MLSLSEVFASLQPGAFPPGRITGERFHDLLARPRRQWTLALRHRIEPPEFGYPLDARRRFSRDTGVPPLATICLPALTPEPDELHDGLVAFARRLSPDRAGALYRELFDWLAERFGRPAWVERSGGSLKYANRLVDEFDGASFVHLYRDGVDTALSMREHPFFRLALVREKLVATLGFDPYDGDRDPGEVRAELRGLLPRTFDAAVLRSLPIGADRFGRDWSAMILHGTRALARAKVLHVAYARLLAEPHDELARIVAFLELPAPPPGWIDWAAAQMRAPRSRRASLAPAELEHLERACAPGERALRALTPNGR